MTAIHSVLVANRGEIALRIMRTVRSLGYRSIAVYSTADRAAPHVSAADDAVPIGAAPALESYLDPQRILAAAAESGADAIHPGYGFLSENADFARAVEAAGLVFVGPGGDAIELMGNKAAAKRRMLEAGVPCVPGYQGSEQSDDALCEAARQIGYPLMVKAAAGGGGRGMRLVRDAPDLENALQSARSEALNAFGSDELILEKAIVRPRHVEVQVFADSHGNAIHLGERDCSVQRRHQKVIEEAPCPVMSTELRARMGAAAVDAARSIDYRGAGTVEFLLDRNGDFYFLEMNTRLQVEHPVTEMITGLDLVALQIRVAEGRELGVSQESVQLNGHAIEARLYAEDPAQDFLPVSGRIASWRPAAGEGLRIDSGIASGLQVSPFYDPMLAKVIAWGEDREVANSRLIEALKQTRLFGLTTNRTFLVDMLERDTFRNGEATTAFIEEEFAGSMTGNGSSDLEDAMVAAVLQFLVERDSCRNASLGCGDELLDWTSRQSSYSHYRYNWNDTVFDLTVSPQSSARYRVHHGDTTREIEVLTRDDQCATLNYDGRRRSVGYLCGNAATIHLAQERRAVSLRNELAAAASEDEQTGGGRVTAPMHGVLLEVLVEPGQQVRRGARLAVLEAMKMQHELLCEVEGQVSEVVVAAGSQVAADDLLIEIAVKD